MIPSTLLVDVLLWKNRAPIIITKMGVSEFSVPASALSIPSSAMQNKYAGNKLPNKPERNMIPILSLGIRRKYLIAVGSNTIPENTIRSDATW